MRSVDKFAPRTIDLDLILYGTSVINGPDLRLPDPSFYTYSFVAVPFLELAPDIVMPDTGKQLSTEPVTKLKIAKSLGVLMEELLK